ncbi:MAG: M36 family metallopeptidase, partial [Bryobacteraceae bacterium]
MGEYFTQSFGAGIRSRPFSNNMSINPITFGMFGRVAWFGPEVHRDGETVSALWEARANLIRQFGEREGRRRMALLVFDGMKLSPPSPSMIDMRDAILLADRTTYKGASQEQLWAGFAKRGLGALAQSSDANTVNVSES